MVADSDLSSYEIHSVDVSIEPRVEFTVTIPGLSRGDTHLIIPDRTGSVTLSHDHGSDGVVDQTQVIHANNSAKTIYMPLIVR